MRLTKVLGIALGVTATVTIGTKFLVQGGIDLVLTDEQWGRLDKFILEDSTEWMANLFDKVDDYFEDSRKRVDANKKARLARIDMRKDREAFFEFQRECKTIGDYLILRDKAHFLALTDPLMKKAADDLDFALARYIQE